ncbi:MAG TPA: endolytic transglycosylase MltG [Usitatibacteraceae bacterium]
MKRILAVIVLVFVLAAGLLAAWYYNFANSPLPLPVTPFEFTVKPGTSLKTLSRQLTGAGLLPEPQLFALLGRITQTTAIQAGTYRLDAPTTPLALLQKLNDGDVVPVSVTFLEGATFADIRAQLEHADKVKVTLKGLSDAEVMKRIGAVEAHPEGLLFPDTYRFAAGTSDLELLKKSYQAMQKKLAEAWAMRDAGLPYKSPYEVLIMASIIEKETGRAIERPLIASVFINRLQIPMRLQTDPTVIYGMGANYDGNIRKRDLTTDTPYNTYTRDGLPPTPIALPGWGSLRAAVKPAQSDKLYFVGKGDGTHYFSSSLEEHNRAVGKYQLGH